MAIITLYMSNPEQSNSSAGLLNVTTPAASTSTTGWTTGNYSVSSTSCSRMSFRIEKANSTFGPNSEPSGAPLGKAVDCFRISAATSGTFSAGTWYSSVSVIAVSAGGTRDGRARFRIWRSSSEDATSPTEVTNGIMVGSNVTDLTSSVAQSSSASTWVAGFTTPGEYFFLQVAWEYNS